jgi:class 3 adenylate cyclase
LAEREAMEARRASEGERKTITALFADLKGSTALIEGLDPEEARAIIDPALQLMMEAVHRYEGYVAQALGDGFLLCLVRLLPTKIIPSAPSMLLCVCKRRWGGIVTNCDERVVLHCRCGRA